MDECSDDMSSEPFIGHRYGPSLPSIDERDYHAETLAYRWP